MKKIVVLFLIGCLCSCSNIKNNQSNASGDDHLKATKERLESAYDDLTPDLINYTKDDINKIEQMYNKKYGREFRIIYFNEGNIKSLGTVFGYMQDLSNKNYPFWFDLPVNYSSEDIVDGYVYGSSFVKRCDTVYYEYFNEIIDVDFLLATKPGFYTNYGIDLTDENLLEFNEEHIFVIFAIEETSENRIQKTINEIQGVVDEIYSRYNKDFKFFPIFEIYVVPSFNNINKLTDLTMTNTNGGQVFNVSSYYEKINYIRHFSNLESDGVGYTIIEKN